MSIGTVNYQNNCCLILVNLVQASIVYLVEEMSQVVLLTIEVNKRSQETKGMECYDKETLKDQCKM